MAKVLLLNPKSRRRKSRKKPSAKQLAARRKFIAMAKARAAAKRKAAKPNPTRKKRRTRKTKRNPIMARRRKSVRRRRSPMRLFRRRARRNPIVPRGFVQSHVSPAAMGAAGALLNDAAVGALITRLPTALQKMEVRHVVKGITAIGLGVLATKGRVASSATAKALTIGALTCVFHDAARAQVQKLLPTIPLGEMLSEVVGPWDGGLHQQLDYYADDDYGMDDLEVDADDLVIS